MRAIDVYAGSNGEITKQYYEHLNALGPIGIVAMNLFRAHKASSRAKVYRGGIRGQGSFKRMAYDKKQWSLQQLCDILKVHAHELGIVWGWKEDPETVFGEQSSWVLYCELPTGQVSFHNPSRGDGPDYQGEWDNLHASQQRILEFCDIILQEKAA